MSPCQVHWTSTFYRVTVSEAVTLGHLEQSDIVDVPMPLWKRVSQALLSPVLNSR